MIPTVRLGKQTVTRFLVGGNPFAGFSHQGEERDAAMRAWYTDERIVETLLEAESLGVNALVGRGDAHMARCFARYRQQGGAMQWVAQTASESPTQVEGVRFCVDHGAAACFIHGGIVDNYLAQGREDDLIAAVEEIRKAGLPAGIAGHLPEDFLWAEEQLSLDFYMVCYYNPNSRRDSPHHVHGAEERYDPQDREERVAILPRLTRPAIHYKALAAGRLTPQEGLSYAAQHMRPGDAVCVGVYTGDKANMLREDIDVLLAHLKRPQHQA